MAGFRNRWLRPATVAALLFASASFGCQVEWRIDGTNRPIMAPSGDAPQRPPEQKTGANRPDVLPLLYTHEDDPLPLGSPEAPATLGRNCITLGGTPNYSLPSGGTPNYSLPSSSITAGCAGRGSVSGAAMNLPIPTEKQMTTHPAYIIEPPDILLLQPVRLIPKPPYHVEPLDLLQIQVAEALPNQPINGPFVVSPEGVVNLGYGYGVVRVGGLTIEQAAQAIKTQLKMSIKEPQVAVSLLQFRGVQQTAGEHLVIQDGTITLGSYGSVFVAGMTICQAKAAIERHLSCFLQNPEISLSVNAYNSKVYYVINDGAGFGMTVHRFPITGNETVLDAITLNGGLAPVASRRRIWLARPGAPGAGCYQILPINWDAIVMGGDTTTNWQIFPGDRIFIDSDPFLWFNNTLTKIFAPIEQLLGVTLLGATTFEALNGNLFTNNNGR